MTQLSDRAEFPSAPVSFRVYSVAVLFEAPPQKAMSWIHESAVVLGNVDLAEDTSVWPTAVIRGDLEKISIGARTNIQDGSVIHADPGIPTTIGEDCVIGHRAIVHGSTLEDGVLIGMGAILLNRCHIGRGSIVGAGSVCTEGLQVPPGSLVIGTPARVVKSLSQEQQGRILDNAARYVALSKNHQAGEVPRVR